MVLIDENLKIRHRRLPHWQAGGRTLFVTFRSVRGDLPEAARNCVMDCIRHDDGHRYQLLVAVS